MPKLNAYLSFDGNCTEAMKFYAKVLDGKLEALITYAQAGSQMPAPPEHGDKVMHAWCIRSSS